MNLHEFVEKFSGGSPNFEDALQNFTNKICEKQRGNCARFTELIVVADEYVVDEDSILNAEQPKIDDLNKK